MASYLQFDPQVQTLIEDNLRFSGQASCEGTVLILMLWDVTTALPAVILISQL